VSNVCSERALSVQRSQHRYDLDWIVAVVYVAVANTREQIVT